MEKWVGGVEAAVVLRKIQIRLEPGLYARVAVIMVGVVVVEVPPHATGVLNPESP